MRYLNSISQIAIFVKVAELQSLTKAANILHLTPSAITKSLNQLEAHLRTTLLKRTTRSVSLTPQGQLFLEKAKKIITDVDDAMGAVYQDGSVIKGSLRLTTSIAYGYKKLSSIVDEYQKIYNEVNIFVNLDDKYINLAENNIDLALRITSKNNKADSGKKLTDIHWIYCAAPSYLSKNKELKTPEDIKSHTCLVYPNMSENGTWTFERQGVVEKIKVSGKLSANSSLILLDSAINGRGIACLPNYAAEQALADGKLIRVLSDYRSTIMHQLYAVYIASKYNNPLILNFIEFLKVHYEENSMEVSY